ncbi:MAG TPA: 2Fe-2S iron-sulfur cluster-binding protein [Casimicrobiaceae bacterium]|nr:2Fe-2S iron-sulfur cluster-binding protein [Casimicrobiaceae bacterium]
MSAIHHDRAQACLTGALARRPTQRDIRLASGLVLFAYVTSHLVNHALGLISIDAAERGLALGVRVWQSVPGTVLLYGAAATHLTLAFVAIYRRRTLRMPPADLLRILLGLGIPLLLIGHAVATRLAHELYGYAPEYHRVVWALWTSNGEGRQLALLVPGWLHGCLGLHFAFSRHRLYQRLRVVLFAAALLLPILAGLGFLSMGKELAANPSFLAAMNAIPAAAPAEGLALARLRDSMLALYFSSIALVFAAREIRALVERQRNLLVTIEYPQRVVRVPRGWTVLEASRSHHIPHMSMCGGRARCSTCRVRVVSGETHCPTPGADEARTLARIGAPASVRLACQLRPDGDITVVPLLAAAPATLLPTSVRTSVERDIVVMLVDWCGRTAFAKRHLPQDVLYFARLFGEAVVSAVRTEDEAHCEIGGDDVAVLFGLNDDFGHACRSALEAAARVERALEAFRNRHQREFGDAARFTVVMHAGHAAVGDIGFQDAHRLVAVGPAADTANRLRARAAEIGVKFIVSSTVLDGAAATLASDETQRVELAAAGATTIAYTMSSITRAFAPTVV